MGSVCCCLSADEFEDYVNRNSSVYRNCVCLNCFLQNFMNAYSAIFHRGDVHSLPSSIQGAASMASAASLDNSLSDMHDKGSSHLNEESEPLRGDVDGDQESLNSGGKWNGSSCEDASKEYRSKSSVRFSSAKYATGAGLVYASSEEEDVCPTCLEEYTEENPRILTKCSHHFHLSCIYEWMERSESCPVCGKVMVFDETT
ncbi:E3 ubiquitin-protein ligase At3g02290-like isoform X2 [Prosopis cineraria]|uniref:E3 ubiquitin-protein ligase At3g02290-like isoform X2 n=1 Tax=Prosopis cineraria TaxID=364024 RepID=UPI0024100D25|nr:E3 ubiquitin-protein ligase At3g02290-like isoform X2 [Prosopis cineraria]